MKVGVVGATGLVGSKLIELLEKTILPIDEIRFIASCNSMGSIINFKSENIQVSEISDEVFDNLDLVFFMATNDIAQKYVKIACSKGAVIIDNSSSFRMDENIPLVVPEVNFNVIKKENKVIANPNCSTIQLVVVLNLLDKISQIKRVDVSTYQAVSGAGKEAIDEFLNQIKYYGSTDLNPQILPVKNLNKHYKILNNVIPQIDVFDKNGYSKEELKVIYETQKILNKNIEISCTAVRVPVINGHSESVTITFDDIIDLYQVFEIFNSDKSLIIMDDLNEQIYPLANFCDKKEEVFVGRIRKDLYSDNILHMWIVADNLLKGAALNALQIAEKCYLEKTYGW